MTAGSDLVFDHLSHNHIEPRAEYQFFLDVLLVHSDLSLDEKKEWMESAEDTCRILSVKCDTAEGDQDLCASNVFKLQIIIH